jgi:hypothetical protein
MKMLNIQLLGNQRHMRKDTEESKDNGYGGMNNAYGRIGEWSRQGIQEERESGHRHRRGTYGWRGKNEQGERHEAGDIM